jgi:hypothetical protein
MICSYDARPEGDEVMDNRINEIRKRIKALRVSMMEAEAIMHDQINRDEECSEIAGEMLEMRAAMSVLVRERTVLGDSEPILVSSFFIPRRALSQKPAKPVAQKPAKPVAQKPARPVKRHLVPAEKRAR